MHTIQRYIVGQLMLSNPARYSQLRPDDVEGNVFVYHLGALVKAGLVEKVAEGYGLTAEGLRYVGTLSLTNQLPRSQPKIVTQIACQNEKGEWLLFKRRRQPLAGLIGLPYGKIHQGEKVAEAASRELKDKTGLEAELKHRGEVYLSIYKNGELISHLLSHVFSGNITGGELIEKGEKGECFWGKIEGGDDYFPGLTETIALLQGTAEHFFAEYEFRS